jgi:hypothetical protein
MEPSAIPDQYALGDSGTNNSDDEDWEIVETEESHQEHADTASHSISCLTFEFKWRRKVVLHRCTGLRESENAGCKMMTPPNNSVLAVHEQDLCELFTLPVELRLRIYEQVLSIESPKVQLNWIAASHRQNFQPSVLSILETCRRIYVEAEPIFYSINHFVYPNRWLRSVTGFSRTINPFRRNAVRSITISASSAGAALSMIEEVTLLSKLQKLRIERRYSIRYTDVGSWVVLAKQLKMELEKLSELQELEIFTPETVTPTPVEEQMVQRLGQIDTLLQEVISKRRIATVS